MRTLTWRAIAQSQCGLITRSQLAGVGVDRWAIGHRIASERWTEIAPTVILTSVDPLRPEQLPWLGVLAGGPEARLGGVAAAAVDGLRNWERQEIPVYVPYGRLPAATIDGIDYIRTRRHLASLTSSRSGIPRLRLEPAILLWASIEPSIRAAEGALAAVVQQRLATPESLSTALRDLHRLRRSPRFRRTLAEIGGGAHSLAEVEVGRMCRRHGLAAPQRQVRRRGSDGRLRFTDCEWLTADGRRVILEVDGAFHMDIESWEDDIVRQRSLIDPSTLFLRCTGRELRDNDAQVAYDLRRLGVPSVTTRVTNGSPSHNDVMGA